MRMPTTATLAFSVSRMRSAALRFLCKDHIHASAWYAQHRPTCHAPDWRTRPRRHRESMRRILESVGQECGAA